MKTASNTLQEREGKKKKILKSKQKLKKKKDSGENDEY